MVRLVEATDQSIADAAAILRDGGLVALPTETVYGLGADATNGVAVAKIFAAKGRPQINPLIVHGDSAASLSRYVEFSDDAKVLAERFWPGPLTMILPRRADCLISDLCSAGLATLGVRVPAHSVALKLITAAGCPVAAPSANRSGLLSPTAPLHILQGLGNAVDMILAAGPTQYGLESTVVDLSGAAIVILRPGAITAQDIADVLGKPVAYGLGDAQTPPEHIKSPGQLLKHYAPGIPVRLNAVDVRPGEALLGFGSLKFMGVVGGGFAKDLPETQIRNLSDDGDLYQAAANLFRMLRDLDQPEHTCIAVMPIPDQGIGIAINDRLKRAASTQ